MSPSRATLLAVAAAVLAVCVTAQTVFTEFEEVPSVSNDHLKVGVCHGARKAAAAWRPAAMAPSVRLGR
jgi:hypothetical protein